MKAIELTEYGDASVLNLVEVVIPEPGPGEVLIRLDYAGVNFTDIYMRQGIYQHSGTYPTPLPLRLGVEGAGVVAALGEGVSAFKEGDRVAYALPRGAYAEYASVPCERVVRLPEGTSTEMGAALLLQGITAHYLSHAAFPLEQGHVCLVHAGAGGVGQILIQLAKLRGARVIASVGTQEKASVARARGADETIVYREENFREAVRRLTDGEGVDVVYDSVGKRTFRDSLGCLRVRGVCILYGHASGRVEGFDPLELAEAGSVFLTRPHMAHYVRTRQEFLERANAVLGLQAAGRLEVAIDRVFPLEQAREAHAYLEGGLTRGKLLLRLPKA